VPYSGRVEKIDSVIPSLVSATFTLRLQKTFGKTDNVAFDSRVVIVPSENAVMNYLAWRQTNAWRNHNNAYAYWLFRKMGYKPLEAAKKLKGMKTEEIHETLFRHGINLAETPAWQRREEASSYIKSQCANKKLFAGELKKTGTCPCSIKRTGQS